RRRHTRSKRDWSSDVCSSDLETDTSGNIVSENPWNEIILPDANKDRSSKGQLNGVIIDAVTGEGVPDAELTFVLEEDSSVTETLDRKSTRLNSSHVSTAYAVF